MRRFEEEQRFPGETIPGEVRIRDWFRSEATA